MCKKKEKHRGVFQMLFRVKWLLQPIGRQTRGLTAQPQWGITLNSHFAAQKKQQHYYLCKHLKTTHRATFKEAEHQEENEQASKSPALNAVRQKTLQ